MSKLGRSNSDTIDLKIRDNIWGQLRADVGANILPQSMKNFKDTGMSTLQFRIRRETLTTRRETLTAIRIKLQNEKHKKRN